jgi:hypothetical protein
MAYRTTFSGVFVLDRALAPHHLAYLDAFARHAHPRRDAYLAEAEPDPLRIAAGLPVGPEGAFVLGLGHDVENEDPSVIDPDAPASGVPTLRCHWVPTDDGRGMQWDGDAAFYDYVEWLTYVIGQLLAPWGYQLHGEITWLGESEDDRGTLRVTDNRVVVLDEGRFWSDLVANS